MLGAVSVPLELKPDMNLVQQRQQGSPNDPYLLIMHVVPACWAKSFNLHLLPACGS